MPNVSNQNRSTEIKRADARSYARSASDFARLTERYSEAVADHLLDLAAIAPADHVLDIGTGSGLVAVKAAERFDDVDVLGIDQSHEMLKQARLTADAKGLAGRAKFAVMDAENLDVDDCSVDVVTSLYVLRHLPNPKHAVREIFRILKPGGKAVVVVGARPRLISANGLKAAVTAAADRLMHAMGRREISPESLRKFLDGKKVASSAAHAAHHAAEGVDDMFRAVGFASVQKYWFGRSFELSPEEFWEVQAVFDSDARSRLETLPDPYVASLRDEYLHACRNIVRKSGKLIYRTGAEIFLGRR